MGTISKFFSILLCCYGNHADYSKRAIDSILRTESDSTFDIHVGCNECSPETIIHMRSLADKGKIASLIECRSNINKDPMMRLLIDLAKTPYVLWMDDDTHLLEGWDVEMQSFISRRHMTFECAGHIFFSHRSDEYLRFLRGRPWWIGEDHYLEAGHRERVWFPTGGFWLARTEFLRVYNFPDRAMIKKQDDLLLGDLLSQRNGRLINFSAEIMARVKISDGKRRGEGEGNDGWRLTDPR